MSSQGIWLQCNHYEDHLVPQEAEGGSRYSSPCQSEQWVLASNQQTNESNQRNLMQKTTKPYKQEQKTNQPPGPINHPTTIKATMNNQSYRFNKHNVKQLTKPTTTNNTKDNQLTN